MAALLSCVQFIRILNFVKLILIELIRI